MKWRVYGSYEDLKKKKKKKKKKNGVKKISDKYD